MLAPGDEVSAGRIATATSTVRQASDLVVRRACHTYHGVERALARRGPVRAMVAIPRTARFMGETAVRQLREPMPGPLRLPVPAVSAALAAQVALDEVILAVAMGPSRFPRRSDYDRVGAELRDARRLFETRGWLDDPRSYTAIHHPSRPRPSRGGGPSGRAANGCCFRVAGCRDRRSRGPSVGRRMSTTGRRLPPCCATATGVRRFRAAPASRSTR